MSDDEGDGDRILDLVGVALVGFILVAVGVGVFAVTVLSPGGEGDAPETSTTTPGTAPPEVTWVLNRVNDSHVQIGHAGGDPIAGAELVVTVDGAERPASFPDRVTTGEAGIVRAGSGATVRLYWTGGSGDRIRLGEWTAP